MSTPTPIPTSPTGSAAPAGPQAAPAAASAPNGLFNQLFAATVLPAAVTNPAAPLAGNQGGKTLPPTGKVLPFSADTAPATPANGEGGVLGLMQQILNAAPESAAVIPGAVSAAAANPAVESSPLGAVAAGTPATAESIDGEYLPASPASAVPDKSLIALHTIAVRDAAQAATGDVAEAAQSLRQQFKPASAPGQLRTSPDQSAAAIASEAMTGQTKAMPINAAGAALAGKLIADTGTEQFAVQLRDAAAAGTPLPASGGVIDTSLARADLRGLGLLSNAATVAPNPLPSLHTDTLSTERWSRALGERVVWMVNAGNHKATIQLHPAELGQIELRVSMTQQHASVEITAQQASTREMLEQMSPRLVIALEASGIKLDELKVQAEDAGRQNGRNAQSGEGQLAQSGRDDTSAGGREQGGATGEHNGAAEPLPDITGMSLLNVRSIDLYA